MPDDLRTVARYASVAEANIARNSLDAAGIPAWVADELTLTADPLFSGAVNYIKVQVRADDLERAPEALSEEAEPIRHSPNRPATLRSMIPAPTNSRRRRRASG